jgi:hypothetical protein
MCLPISPSCTPLERSATFELLARRDAAARDAWMLPWSADVCTANGCATTDQVSLLRRETRDRYDYEQEEHRQQRDAFGSSRDDTVVPGEYCELVYASGEIPACSRVARDENSEREYGERVHLQRRAKRGGRDSLLGGSLVEQERCVNAQSDVCKRTQEY